jgi:hypothetical protein
MDNDKKILELIESQFIQLQEIKSYVKSQIDYMKKTYPDQEFGIIVLNYIHNIMLKNIKDKDEVV